MGRSAPGRRRDGHDLASMIHQPGGGRQPLDQLADAGFGPRRADARNHALGPGRCLEVPEPVKTANPLIADRFGQAGHRLGDAKVAGEEPHVKLAAQKPGHLKRLVEPVRGRGPPRQICRQPMPVERSGVLIAQPRKETFQGPR